MNWAPFMALLAARGDVVDEYGKLRGRLYAFFIKRGRDVDAAAELADASILDIARFAQTTEIKNFMAYAFTVARSRLLKVRAKEDRHQAKEPAILQELYAELPPEVEWDDPRLDGLRAAFAKLSKRRQRLLLDYFECDGRKERQELHEWYGWPSRRVVDRVSRAVCILRRLVRG